MIWLTWRQFRAQAWFAVGGLVILAALLAIAANEAAAAYRDSGLATCGANCDTALRAFIDEIEGSVAGVAVVLGIGLTYLVPPLIGVFWGAPLIARELETGTHRLAWNQSVTRTRWLVTKLAAIAAVSIATTGLLSLLVTWSGSRVDEATGQRLMPLAFAARGVVPIGYAAFAFTLGVTMGLLIRRTVPAMAATLVVYAAAVAAMPLWIREHLLPIRRALVPLVPENINGLSIDEGNSLTVFANDDAVRGAWVLSNDTVDSTGNLFTGPADPQYCGRAAGPDDCFGWLGSLGLRQDLRYHSLDQYWALQWTETGIFVGLAAALAVFCVWWTRRLT